LTVFFPPNRGPDIDHGDVGHRALVERQRTGRNHSDQQNKRTAIFDAAKVTLTAIRPMYIPRPLVDLATPITERAIGISHVTLRKHFRQELDLAEDQANFRVAQFMFSTIMGISIPGVEPVTDEKTRTCPSGGPSVHYSHEVHGVR
jgi:hypothetical protein